jgi:hypothetical protein
MENRLQLVCAVLKSCSDMTNVLLETTIARDQPVTVQCSTKI